MTNQLCVRLGLIFCIVGLLFGCGQFGALYLPKESKQQTTTTS